MPLTAARPPLIEFLMKRVILGLVPTREGRACAGDDAGEPGRDPVFGNGILNIGQAYARARTMAGS